MRNTKKCFSILIAGIMVMVTLAGSIRPDNAYAVEVSDVVDTVENLDIVSDSTDFEAVENTDVMLSDNVEIGMETGTEDELINASSDVMEIEDSAKTTWTLEEDDPLYQRVHDQVDYSGLNDAEAELNGYPANANRVRGIDVSFWNGTIDWNKAKQAGIEFAIIRVGYRGSQSGTLNADEKYKEYIKGAQAAGIKVGVYFFTQAVTVTEAVEEAEYTCRLIQNYHIDLPVVIDYEYVNNGRLQKANLSKAQATAICDAFCDTVESVGYTGMVYSFQSLLQDGLDGKALAKEHKIWIASWYVSAPRYSGDYDFWQYADNGKGSDYGCSSKAVDLDYWYDDGSIQSVSMGKDTDYLAIQYCTFQKMGGWTPFVKNGTTSGDSEQIHSISNIIIKLTGLKYAGNDGNVLYQTYMQDSGWSGWMADGSVCGDVEQSQPIEAIQVNLSGGISNTYNVYYRVFQESGTWTAWAENGDTAGTPGSETIKAMEICLIRKGCGDPTTTQIIYRLYNRGNGEHLFTTNMNERDVLDSRNYPDWIYEGDAWYAPLSGTPVYRLYNGALLNHLYTTDTNEVQVLTSKYGWVLDNNGEPIFYSGGETPIYRLYAQDLNGMHHYTTEYYEYMRLPEISGYIQEGTAFYAK